MIDFAKRTFQRLGLWRQQLFAAIAVEVFFLVLFLFFGVVRYGALDDYFMSVVLTGGYNSLYDPHLVFVNATYAYFLKPFYLIFPSVGWFYIFEILGIFWSFCIYAAFIIRRLGFKFGIPFTFLISSLSLELYSNVSFTQCAAALVAAGGLLFLEGISRNRKLSLFAACGFLVAGAVMRWQMFLLGLPFLFIALVLKLQIRDVLKVKTLAMLALCGLVALGTQKFDDRLYVDQEHQYYRTYQGARSLFGDGRHYDKNAVYDELEEGGLNGLDFQLLTSWTYYDTEVFSADSLKPFINAINRNSYQINWSRVPIAIFIAVSNAFTRNEAWFWFLGCVLILVFSNKKKRLYPWFSIGAIALCYSYLFILNRLAPHVEMGIWTYAIVMTIPLLPDAKEMDSLIPQKSLNKIAGAFSVVALFFVASSVVMFPNMETEDSFASIPLKTEKWKLFEQYAESHPDDVFLLDFVQYKELGMVKDPAYRAAAPGSWKNIFPIGYWNIHLPAMKRELERRGVGNPLHDIIHENVYLLESGNTPKYQSFYARHYHKNLVVDTVESLGELKLLKYREPEVSR